MKNVLRALFLGSLMLSVASCELFSPKEWAKYKEVGVKVQHFFLLLHFENQRFKLELIRLFSKVKLTDIFCILKDLLRNIVVF